MKKQIFDEIVSTIAANPGLYSTHKITNKDGLEVHTFGWKENKSLDEAKALFKAKGYKGEEVYKEADKLHSQNKLDNSYYTFLYNHEKDKISIGLFTVGYAYASRKERFYPLCKKIPILAWTKHLYSFTRTLKNKRSPRIQLGRIAFTIHTPIADILTKIMYNIDYDPRLWISYRHYINTKNDYEALENYTGDKISQVLTQHSPEILLSLYKSLKNYEEIKPLFYYILEKHPLLQMVRGSKTFISITDNEELVNKIKDIQYDLFVLLISNKLTEEEYQNILAMSNSADEENIVIAREIINFKLEDGSN